jgi:SAM-dependent methyltransferase
MQEPTLREIYRPTHDEAARQRFVGILKAYANGEVEEQLSRGYAARHPGAAPATRDAARQLFESEPLYQLWGSLVYCSQNLMWQTVATTVERIRPTFEARAQAATKAAPTPLTLRPELTPPLPIRRVEIHRQPGGYFAAREPNDLSAALLYLGSIELYRAAKGLSANTETGEPGLGRFIAGVVRRRFPVLRPRRILDLGCGPGLETVAFKEQYPDAEVHALDLSAPFVRFAHAWSADRGMPLHVHQADAQDTQLPDAHFDLIVSHILLHETSSVVMPKIFAEARRLLAPGGVFLNADVPYQPERLSVPKKVTNDWQVRNNGEPFWTGFADSDVAALLRDAGFDADRVLADYEALGAGHYFFFGASTK